MQLVRSTEEHLVPLMTWFEDKTACRLWGGPYFRYPYNLQTFSEDIVWQDYDSFSLLDEQGVLLGFGQFYIKEGRVHLARLVISPESRGRGHGKKLIQALIAEGKALYALSEFSLYVYKHNQAALYCYESIGFVKHPYPSGAPFEEVCFFMVKNDC